MKVFNDIKEWDTIYYIVYNNINTYPPMLMNITNSKVYDTAKLNGHKIIYFEGGKFRIPFNHLNANRLKINKYITVFLSKKAFRKYCFKNIEKVIESEETKWEER